MAVRRGQDSPALERSWLPLPWGRLNVWRSGEGPAIVALHGLGGSGRYWTGLAPLLGSGRTLLSPDLAGFGQSDKPALRYDREFHLANLDSLIASHVSGAPVGLVGHSVGGVLAALWAARYPERTAALGLVSSPYPRRGIVPPPALRIAQSPPDDRRSSVAIGVFRTVWPVVHLAARATRRFPPDVIRDYGRQSIGARADTMWTLLGDLSIEKDLEGLRDLSPSVPILLLSAADDRHAGDAIQAKWRRLLPTAEVTIVPSGGHQFLIRNGFEPLADWINR